MERRFYLGIAILSVVLIFGLLGGYWVESTNRQVVAYLQSAESAARDGAPQLALELAQQAQTLWRQSWRRLAALSDHSSMDEIDGLFAQMEHYARESGALLGAICARVRELVTAVSDGHQLTWWNLF